MALEHNLGLRVERYSSQIIRYGFEGSYGYYDPILKIEAEENYSRNPGLYNPRRNLTVPPVESTRDVFDASLTGHTPTGMKYELFTTMSKTVGTFTPFFAGGRFIVLSLRPEYSSAVGLAVTQPLLKDFWTDAQRTQIKVSRRNLKISELAFKGQLMDLVRKVQEIYYDLIFARQNIQVQQNALDLAERFLSESRDRLQIGVVSALDEKQAEAQVAAVRTDLLSFQNQLTVTENLLKNLITDDFRSWHDIVIQPSEKLVAVPESYNLAQSWQHGLELRPDIKELEQELEKQNIILRFRQNQLFPSLDLVASAAVTGLETNFSSSLDQIRDTANPKWVGGVVFSIPLALQTERNNYKAAKTAKTQALFRLKKLEQDILVEIKDAVELAKRNYGRIDSARKAREFAEAASEAEQQKLEKGKSTTFVVLELQNKLTRGRSVEIQVIAEYNKSLIELYFREGTVLERSHIDFRYVEK